MRTPMTLKNFTVFIDGYGQGGIVSEGTPPKLALETAEHSAGGMAGTVDIPMGAVQKMEFEATLKEFDPTIIGLFGQEGIGVTFRGAQGNATGVDFVIIETRCLMREVDQGTWKPKEPGELKVAFTASYYRQTIAGEVVAEVDVENMIFRSGGVDHFEAIRAALGE